MKKVFFVLLLVFAAGCGSTVYQTEGPPLLEPIAPVVNTDVVRRGEVIHKEIHSGVVRLISHPLFFDMEIGEFAGFGRFYVQPGETVFAGQLLASLYIDHILEQIEEHQEQIAEMRRTNELNNRRQSLLIASQIHEHSELVTEAARTLDLNLFARAERLEESIQMQQIALSQAIEMQNWDLQEANRLLSNTQRLLEGSELFAPFDGIVTYIVSLPQHRRIEQRTAILYIAENMRPIVQYTGTAFRLADMHHFVRATANINGTSFELEFADITPDEREFYVLQNIRMGRQQVHVFPVRFNILSDDLPPIGSFAALHLYHVYEEDVLRLPRTAVFVDGREGYYVLRIIDGRQEQIFVDAVYTPTYAVIKNGLEEGDVVFVRR